MTVNYSQKLLVVFCSLILFSGIASPVFGGVDTEKPVITPAGASASIAFGSTYTELGGTVTDNDPVYSEVVTVGGATVNTLVLGDYIITYNAPADAAGNTPDQKTITITVEPITITISNVTQVEGDSGTSNFIFAVGRSTNSGAISVQYQTADSTATSTSDYTPLSLNTLAFTAGGSSILTISVPVKGDIAVEPNETFNVNLSNCTGCIITGNPGIGTILDDDTAGSNIQNIGSLGSADGEFHNPLYIAVDSSDRVIVADTFNHRIQIFNSAGAYQSQFGSAGSGNGQFDNPIGIAIDSANRILVADAGNNRVQVFNSAGEYQSNFGSVGSGNGQFDNPKGIAVKSADRILVGDTLNNRVQIFDSTGNHLQSFGVLGSGDGQFNNPTGVSVDSADRIIVADTLNNRLQIFHGSPPVIDDLDSDGIPDSSDTENIINLSTTITKSHTLVGNVIVQNGAVLTIPNGLSLSVPSGNNITILSGGGVLIEFGGALIAIS